MNIIFSLILILSLLNQPQIFSSIFDSEFSFSKSRNLSGINSFTTRDSEMVYIYNSPESSNDKRYDYVWEIMRTSLEKTKTKYGSYVMKPAKFMNEKRQEFELQNNSQNITVMYLDLTPEREKKLIPIKIPVDKNLVGYRIFLIRKQDQSKFNKVRNLNDLKKFSFGLGLNWIDVDIYKANKLKVVSGSNYEGLFKMLLLNRFDVFSRGSNEVVEEYENHIENFPELRIENNLILYYPLPMFFWFSHNKKGESLANRVKEGMMEMIEDGSYDKIFNKYYSDKINKLNFSKRRIIKINNPFFTNSSLYNDKRLWFDPTKN